MSFKHRLLEGQLLDRQEAKDVDSQELQSYDIMQFKYDGIWCCFDGKEVISRNGLLKDVREEPKWPSSTLVAGEFMFGSQWAQNPERLGKIYCFDLLMLSGEDLRSKPYQLRYAALRDLIHVIAQPRLSIVNSYSTAGNVDRTLAALQRNRSYEGLVGRNWSQSYTDTIGRHKLSLSDDFVIMNVLPGEGKHSGRMGALAVGQYIGEELVEIMTVGGGFSDEQREAIMRFPHNFIGRVIEVSGKMRFESGAFRHPNLERFRDDKSARECRFVKPASAATIE